MLLFVAMGDATDIRTRGGTPYFLSTAGKRADFIQQAAALDLNGLRFHRMRWNLARWLRYRERGGYQFSRSFAELVFRKSNLTTPVSEVLSQYPLFPPDSWLPHSKLSYYIDATLKQNFDEYGLGKIIGARMREETLARERARYLSAARLICMSRWSARSMVEYYGVSADKVHVIPAGANIDSAQLPVLEDEAEPMAPLRLGFIGKDVQRKNLGFLLRIAENIAMRKIPVEVVAAGFEPAAVPSHRLLRPVGFFNKRQQMHEFISFARSCHFGCLFSHAEAYGLSNVEFIRLGVPVLTWDVGGQADTVPEGLGHVFPADATSEQVAETVARYASDFESYRALRRHVLSRNNEVTFERTIERFQAVWRGSREHAYTKS